MDLLTIILVGACGGMFSGNVYLIIRLRQEIKRADNAVRKSLQNYTVIGQRDFTIAAQEEMIAWLRGEHGSNNAHAVTPGEPDPAPYSVLQSETWIERMSGPTVEWKDNG